uniref:Uncharacterized protein n=1 Tax=Anguilla anguilla TaxID=7936 RepID=A0A0E9PXT9_ANGAN
MCVKTKLLTAELLSSLHMTAVCTGEFNNIRQWRLMLGLKGHF